MPEFFESIGVNLLADFIWAALGAVVLLFIIRFRWLRKLVSRLGIRPAANSPELDFYDSYDPEKGVSSIRIKNAGKSSAYNVYGFLFEVFNAMDVPQFTITSLGEQEIRVGVLGAGEEITFSDKVLMFDGCSVTCTQEIWFEYSDADEYHYRTRILPPTPRGDDIRIMPPIKIDQRLPLWPGWRHSGEGDGKKIMKGKVVELA